MICSSRYYEGTSNVGRECFYTSDGITYKPTGYLMMDHRQGKMVKSNMPSNTVMMIGGFNPSWYMEEYNYTNDEWFIRKNNVPLGGVVGFREVFIYK